MPLNVCSYGRDWRGLAAAPRELIGDLRLHEARELRQRLLPAEITRFDRDRGRQAGLLDIDLGAHGDRLEHNGDVNRTGQIGVVEAVGVADALVRNELEVFPPERMAVAGRKVLERHLERAADFWFQMLYGAGKPVWR